MRLELLQKAMEKARLRLDAGLHDLLGGVAAGPLTSVSTHGRPQDTCQQRYDATGHR